jgi:DNA-binding SARP family transcriptional activator
MRYYARLGDRAGLVRQYRQLRHVLQDALKVEPAPTTQQLYQSLLQQVKES